MVGFAGQELAAWNFNSVVVKDSQSIRSSEETLSCQISRSLIVLHVSLLSSYISQLSALTDVFIDIPSLKIKLIACILPCRRQIDIVIPR